MARKDTEQKIEDAAISLFSEKGYKGTSTRRIAKEAGVSELTIYRCYNTKEELFRQALIKRAPGEWLKDMGPAPNGVLEEQLILLFERLYETLMDRQDLIRIFYREGAEYPDIVAVAKQVPSKIWGPIADYIQRAKPGLSAQAAVELAIQTFGTYLGMILLSTSFGPSFLPTSMKAFHASMARTYTYAIRDAECTS